MLLDGTSSEESQLARAERLLQTAGSLSQVFELDRFPAPVDDTEGRAVLLALREIAARLAKPSKIERAVLRPALNLGASGLYLFHNHPSEDPMPSYKDIRFTRAIGDACLALDIQLCDHLILGGPGRWKSLAKSIRQPLRRRQPAEVGLQAAFRRLWKTPGSSAHINSRLLRISTRAPSLGRPVSVDDSRGPM